MNKASIFIIILVLVYAAGFVGSLFTSSAVNSSWYLSNKPSITPPNWIFPVVWNILYLLIAISLFLAWIKANKKQKNSLAWLFGINLAANAVWSILFFGMQLPLLAFVDLIIILGSAIWAKVSVWKISKTSSYLLIPYILWLIFAGILNYLFI